MKNSLLKYHTTAIYLFSTSVLFAQSETDENAIEGMYPATARIDDYIFLMSIMGVVFVLFRLRALHIKKSKRQKRLLY